MDDQDRLAIATLDYTNLLRSSDALRDEGTWSTFRSLLERMWFDLYIENLLAHGYANEGDLESYNQGAFTYSVDNTIDSALEDSWWQEHRENARIVCVHGHSAPATEKRDASRMRFHANTWVREFGESRGALPFDKGHFIAHTVGGVIDMGIFAQRRDINRGWSPLGRTFRSMERYVQEIPGSFVFSRPIYGDGSTQPFFLEYGILKEDGAWWIEVFPNRYTYTPFRGPDSVPEWRMKSWR